MAKKSKLTSLKKENTKQNSNSDQLSEIKPIDNSPFVARKYDNKWIVTVGKYRTKHELESYEECINLVNNPDWAIYITLMHFVADTVKNETSISKI